MILHRHLLQPPKIGDVILVHTAFDSDKQMVYDGNSWVPARIARTGEEMFDGEFDELATENKYLKEEVDMLKSALAESLRQLTKYNNRGDKDGGTE